INILIKLMSMVSIVFGGFIVAYSPKIEALYMPKQPTVTESPAPIQNSSEEIVTQDAIIILQ
ncbi:MAG: hypothetical protein PWP64_1331, partial [Candidatus Cloacimonadota bacterium]|nr:hypothetical protein [Candidatus Cloacimonadota bacterium]